MKNTYKMTAENELDFFTLLDNIRNNVLSYNVTQRFPKVKADFRGLDVEVTLEVEDLTLTQLRKHISYLEGTGKHLMDQTVARAEEYKGELNLVKE